jgi:hypothetical protein
MTLLVNVSIFFCPILFALKLLQPVLNGYKVSCGIAKNNSMLFEVQKICSLILVNNAALNSFAQNLHFSSQEFPCFISGVTHSTNVHSSALERGHGVVCFLETKGQLSGVEEELVSDIFTNNLQQNFVQEN